MNIALLPSMTTNEVQLSLTSSLAIFAEMFPVNGLFHIGAGATGSTALYEAIGAQNLFLIEARPDLVDMLSLRFENLPNAHVRQAVLAKEGGEMSFHVASLGVESSTLPVCAMSPFWKNIATVEEFDVTATTLSAFVQNAQDIRKATSRANWLLVDCFPSLDILQGAEDLLHDEIEVVVVRTIAHEAVNGNLKLMQSDEQGVHEYLGGAGFRRVSEFSERHPHIKLLVFARDYKQRAEASSKLEKQLKLTRQDLEQTRADYEVLARANEEQSAILEGVRAEIDEILTEVAPSRTAAKRAPRTAKPRNTVSKSDDV